MPLLDHFHPPLAPRRQAESFLAAWACSIADVLNRDLPQGYFAEVFTRKPLVAEPTHAPFEITDVASITPVRVIEVQVRVEEGEGKLVGALRFITPALKERSRDQVRFVLQCAQHIDQGLALLVVDIVTGQVVNMHQAIMSLVLAHGVRIRDVRTRYFTPPDGIFATAFGPYTGGPDKALQVRTEALQLGKPLPTLPLYLDAERCLPIDLEATYTDACQRRRIGA